jgi:hypothetical protein
MFSHRRVALLSALASASLAGSLGLAALPANAAVSSPHAIGQIVCSGDLCIQTNSVDLSNCTAVVAAWANNNNFYGHFEIVGPGSDQSSEPDQEWIAGGANNKFTVPYHGAGDGYQATAWQDNNGSYSNIGQINFGIEGQGAC